MSFARAHRFPRSGVGDRGAPGPGAYNVPAVLARKGYSFGPGRESLRATSWKTLGKSALPRVQMHDLRLGKKLGQGRMAYVLKIENNVWGPAFHGKTVAARSSESCARTSRSGPRVAVGRSEHLAKAAASPRRACFCGCGRERAGLGNVGYTLQVAGSNAKTVAKLEVAMSRVCKGVACMHSMLCAHGDIKARNVALRLQPPRIWNDTSLHDVTPGTWCGCCPDALQKKRRYPMKTDCYRVGHMFAELRLSMAETQDGWQAVLEEVSSLATVIAALRTLLHPLEQRKRACIAVADLCQKAKSSWRIKESSCAVPFIA